MATVSTSTRQRIDISNPIITRIQVEGNDVVSFLNGTDYIRGMSQILPQSPTYISYRYDSITISQVGGESFTFTVYTITDVGGNTFTQLTFQDSSDVVQAKTIEIYRLLVTSIFKGCCECGNTEPECSIQYTAGTDPTIAGTLWDVGGVGMRINYFTANNQDFTGFWPIIQDGSWIFVFSKTDPTVYGVYQLSNYTDGGTFAQFNSTLLAGPAGFPDGTELCVDVTSVGGSLVQGWQDTLDIDSVLDKDNTVDGAGFNFVFDNNESFTINSGGGFIETNATGASLNAGDQQILVTTAYIDIITPNYAAATEGMVLALTAAGHVEYTLAGTGTISSIGLFMPPAFTVSTPNPLTENGEFTVTVEGTEEQYINGLGELATLPVYTVENGLHTKEDPASDFIFHLGGQLIEDTLIETTDGTDEYQLSVRGSVEQDSQFPFGVANLGSGGVATFQDYGSGDRPNPSVEIVGDVDLVQPLLELRMQGNLPNGTYPNSTGYLSLKYDGATANNVRSSIDFEYPDSGNNMFLAGRLTTELASNVNGNEQSKFDIQLIDGGNFETKLELNGTGQLTLNEYGSGTFINSAPTYGLVVDSTGLVWKKTLVGGGTVTEVTATGLLTTSPDPIETTGTVTSIMDSGFLVGRYSPDSGVFEQITIGDGLTLSATGELTAEGGGGTYDGDQGVYKDTSGATETFMLGAPSGQQSTIAFQENRFVDLDTFTFNMEGVDPVYPGGMVNFNVSGTVGDGFVLNLDSTTGSGLRINAPVSGMEVSQKFASYFLQESDTQNNVLELWRSATNPGPASDKSARISFAIPNPNTGIGYRQAGNIGYIASPENILALQYGTAFVIEGYTFPAIDPNIRRVAQFEGDGQVIFNTYGIGTWASNPLGPAVYGLGVNSAGYVMEVSLGGGSSYLYDQGIYFIPPVNPGDPETIVLGAPSGSQGATAFEEARFIDTNTFRLSFEGNPSADVTQPAGCILDVVVGGSAANFSTGVRVDTTAANKGYGIYVNAGNTGIGVVADGSSLDVTSPTGTIASYTLNDSAPATAQENTRLVAKTDTVSPSVGFGPQITFSMEDGLTLVNAPSGAINYYYSDVNNATLSANMAMEVFSPVGFDPTTPGKVTALTLRGDNDGQLQLNKYTTATAFQGVSGSSIGVLNVDNAGNVFVGDGGSGGGGLKSGNAIQTPPASGAYEATISGVTAYTTGEAFMIKFDSTNEGASTLDINTLGPIDILKNTNVNIAAGDIKAGQEVMVVYDGTNFQAIGLVTNQLLAYVHNSEAAPITKGQVVYAFGASGDRMSVKLALADADATSAKTIGMVYDSSIAAGGEGYIIIQGVIEGIDTSTFAAGATLYLSGTVPGGYVSTPTYAPTHRVYVGIVEKSNPGNGQIYVRCQNGYELDELHDVQAQSPSNDDTLYFDSTDSQWKTASIPTILGYTPADAAADLTQISVSTSNVREDNYAPTGWPGTTDRVKVIRIDSTNTNYMMSLGGLANPSAGRIVTIYNNSAANNLIIIENLSTSSTAANRFRMTSGLPYFLLPTRSITFIYDGTYWTQLSSAPFGGLDFFEDFLQAPAITTGSNTTLTTTTTYTSGVATSLGLQSQSGATGIDGWGVTSMQTGVTATGACGISMNLRRNGGNAAFGADASTNTIPYLTVSKVGLTTLATVAQDYNCYVGVNGKSSLAMVNTAGNVANIGMGYYWRYAGSASSVWDVVTQTTAGVTVTTPTSISATANSDIWLGIYKTGGANVRDAVFFYSTDGITYQPAFKYVGTTSTIGGFPAIAIGSSAGTTFKEIRVDWLGTSFNLSR